MKQEKFPKMAQTIQTVQNTGPVSAAALLRIGKRDRAGLEWLRQRAGLWIVVMRRRRKRLPPGGYSEEEAATLRALIDLEKAASRLLEIAGALPRQG